MFDQDDQFFAGIGSRKTPEPVMARETKIAHGMKEAGYKLRSGAAAGSDSAFEEAFPSLNDKQIFLAKKGYKGHPSPYFNAPKRAFELAARIHPNWDRCDAIAKALHARNGCQILGPDLGPLEDYSKVTICWTEGGQSIGGTRTAIKLSEIHSIPVINLGLPRYTAMTPDQIVETAIQMARTAIPTAEPNWSLIENTRSAPATDPKLRQAAIFVLDAYGAAIASSLPATLKEAKADWSIPLKQAMREIGTIAQDAGLWRGLHDRTPNHATIVRTPAGTLEKLIEAGRGAAGAVGTNPNVVAALVSAGHRPFIQKLGQFMAEANSLKPAISRIPAQQEL